MMADASSTAGDDRSMLVEYLATRDIACPSCGYNLRGVGSPACPECGLELVIRVTPQAPHRVYWYAALYSLLWPMVFNGMVIAAWVLALFLGGGIPQGQWFSVGFSVVMLAVCVLGLAFLITTRKRPWRPTVRRVVVVSLVVIFALHAVWLLAKGAILPFVPWG